MGFVALLLAACTSPPASPAGGRSPEPEPEPEPAPAIPADAAIDVLFPDGAGAPPAHACAGTDAARIRCLLSARYADDPAAAELAVSMFDAVGDVSGVEREFTMQGGFRGAIRIVPELPIGRHRRHLEWVAAASRDHAEFFEALARRAPRPIAYRSRAIAFRWFRSVRRTTPSAYAADWTLGWNVSGSLHKNADKVRETLFHEIFHLNDAGHDDWSRRALATLHAGVVARCGTSRACLRPFAPSETTVRGGTYYAFQPDNGEAFHEYAAELALRYYRETRAVLRGEPLASPPFECGPEPNPRAWALLVEEFFGGADLVDCP